MERISFITLTNNGYKKYTKNCLASLKKFDLDKKLKIFCMDTEAYLDLAKDYEKTIKLENLEHCKEMLTYMDKGWNYLTLKKLDVIYQELLENEFVCFTDGDIVYENGNFLSYCLKHIKDCEFLIQRDDLGKDIPINLGRNQIMLPTVCTGFMFIRRTPNTLRLFKKSNIDQNVKCDQTYINNVLHQFKYKKLPLTVFPNGLYYKLFRKKIKPYMIHFNYTETAEDKRKIMKKYNKWLI
jgi:hypothetical protein